MELLLHAALAAPLPALLATVGMRRSDRRAVRISTIVAAVAVFALMCVVSYAIFCLTCS